MITALLLSIHARDITGIVFTVLWLLAVIIVVLLDYGFKHGWFILSDEEISRRLKSDSKCP